MSQDKQFLRFIANDFRRISIYASSNKSANDRNSLTQVDGPFRPKFSEQAETNGPVDADDKCRRYFLNGSIRQLFTDLVTSLLQDFFHFITTQAGNDQGFNAVIM